MPICPESLTTSPGKLMRSSYVTAHSKSTKRPSRPIFQACFSYHLLRVESHDKQPVLYRHVYMTGNFNYSFRAGEGFVLHVPISHILRLADVIRLTSGDADYGKHGYEYYKKPIWDKLWPGMYDKLASPQLHNYPKPLNTPKITKLDIDDPDIPANARDKVF